MAHDRGKPQKGSGQRSISLRKSPGSAGLDGEERSGVGPGRHQRHTFGGETALVGERGLTLRFGRLALCFGRLTIRCCGLALCFAGLLLCLAALGERDGAGDERQHQADHRRREQPSQPPAVATIAALAGGLLRPAGIEERALRCGRLDRPTLGRLGDDLETSSSVEILR